MRRTAFLVAIRSLVLSALAASSALLYDYTRPPAFCETGAGCDTVRQSAYAFVLGIPQPVIGLFAFLVFFVATLLPHKQRLRFMPPIAVLGGLGGLIFLAIQHFQLHAFCTLCVVTDLSAVAAAVFGLLYARLDDSGSDGRAPAGLWSVGAALACCAPFLFASEQARLQPTGDVPPGVSKHWAPGKVTIVELSDFECPFCRVLHTRLSPVLDAYHGKVNLVRLSVPLPGHKHARGAACAYLCARDQGKGEPMADALFGAEDLSEAGWMKLAESMASQGLQVEKFRACVADAKTEARVSAEDAQAREIGFKGLPTMWIGRQTLLGAVPAEEIAKVIDTELAGVALQKRTPASVMWTALGVLLAALAGYSLSGRRGDKSRAASSV